MNSTLNFNYPFPDNNIFFKKKEEKREIKKLGFYTGCALMLFVLLQYVIVFILTLTGLYEGYVKNPTVTTGLDILISVIDVLVPFLIFGLIMKKKSSATDIAPLGKSKDTALFLLSVPAGLGICMAANLVTSFFVTFLNIFGIVLKSPEIAQPQGFSGFILSVLRVSIVAALAEEIAMRGCIMQPLRKHGEAFAIVASACAFGLMHGNLVQAPFALIVGIGFGYIAIKTGSLWSVIIIHALNNFISTAISYLNEGGIMSEEAVNLLYVIIVYGLIFIGSVCLALFRLRARKICPTARYNGYLSPFEKAAAFIANPAMIFAIIMLFIGTAQFIEIKW